MKRLGLAMGLALALGACGGQVQGRSVKISGNSLRYASTPSGYGGTDQFTWSVTSDQAYIRYDGTELSQGTVQLTLLDAVGQVVLPRVSMSPGAVPASGPTLHGQTGTWTVRVDYDDVTGAVAIDAEGTH